MKKIILSLSLSALLFSLFLTSCEKKEDEGITVTYAVDAGSGNNPNRRVTKNEDINTQNVKVNKPEEKK